MNFTCFLPQFFVEYSGGIYESAKSDERKEFNKMLKFVKSHSQVAFIIVYSFDRFSRTGVNGSYISEQLKKQGVIIISTTQEVDTTTSAGSSPFGYTNTNPGKGKIPNLIINEQGKLLKKAFELKANHDLTYNEITNRLKKQGWTKGANILWINYQHTYSK